MFWTTFFAVFLAMFVCKFIDEIGSGILAAIAWIFFREDKNGEYHLRVGIKVLGLLGVSLVIMYVSFLCQ